MPDKIEQRNKKLKSMKEARQLELKNLSINTLEQLLNHKRDEMKYLFVTNSRVMLMRVSETKQYHLSVIIITRREFNEMKNRFKEHCYGDVIAAKNIEDSCIDEQQKQVEIFNMMADLTLSFLCIDSYGGPSLEDFKKAVNYSMEEIGSFCLERVSVESAHQGSSYPEEVRAQSARQGPSYPEEVRAQSARQGPSELGILRGRKRRKTCELSKMFASYNYLSPKPPIASGVGRKRKSDIFQTCEKNGRLPLKKRKVKGGVVGEQGPSISS